MFLGMLESLDEELASLFFFFFKDTWPGAAFGGDQSWGPLC